MSEVAVLAYNASNTLSVLAALKRLGANPVVSDNKEVLLRTSRIVFPGVGHALPAAQYLRERGLDLLLKQATQPVLGICLGMQLMCEHSEEGDTEGLGIFNGQCRKFESSAEKVPHMGWNNLSNLKGKLFNGIDEDAYVYFVHSYKVGVSPHTSATCSYGQDFSAALEYKNFFGVQFHPEKSAVVGQKILENFLQI